MSYRTCVAGFHDLTAADAAYRACWKALIDSQTFIGWHFTQRSRKRDHHPRRGDLLVVFEIDADYPQEPFNEPRLKESFLIANPVKETLRLLEQPQGYTRLRRSALSQTKAFTPDTLSQPKQRSRSHYAVYAEFDSPARANEVREILQYRPFERWEEPFVLSAETHPDPKCVKILVTGLDKDKLWALGEEFDSLRITRRRQPLYTRQEKTVHA